MVGVALASHHPGPRLWGLHVPGFLPQSIQIGFWLASAAALTAVWAGALLGARPVTAEHPPAASDGEPRKNAALPASVFVVLFTAALWIFRARTQFLGDGSLWLAVLRSGEPLAGHEPLAEALWTGVALALRAIHLQITAGTLAPLSIACGALAAILIWNLARELTRGRGRLAFGVTLVLLATLGSSQLFFGYIESYPPVAVVVLWFLYAGVRALRSDAVPVVPGLVLALAIATHLACLYLLPAYLFLVARTRQRTSVKLAQAIVPLCLAGVLMMAVGFGPQRLIRTIRAASGRAPTAAPHAEVLPRHYEIFSGDHAIDFANEILLVIPVPLVLLVGSAFGAARRPAPRNSTTWFLVLAAASGVALAAPLVLPVAPAQDWDLFSVFLIPAGVLGIYVGLALFEGRGGRLVAGGLSLAAIASLGAFVLVNAISDAGVRRFETLVGPGARISVFARTYAFEWLASYHRHEGDSDKAVQYSLALLRGEPTNPRFWSMVGTNFAAQGKYAAAIPYLEEAIKRGRRGADTRTNLGICYMGVGRNQDALAQFSMAAAEQPARPDFQLNLGLALLNAGQPDSARAVLTRAARQWPRYAPAREALEKHFGGGR